MEEPLYDPKNEREIYKQLRERVHQLRMFELMQEPCMLYEPIDEDDEEGHF